MRSKLLAILVFIICHWSFVIGQVFQGEDADVIDGPAVIASDSALHFWSWGTARIVVPASGAYVLVINCMQEQYGENAKLQIYYTSHNIPQYDTLEVAQTSWDTLRTIVYVDSGYFEFSFINDYVNPDRNLFVDCLNFRQRSNELIYRQVEFIWDPPVSGNPVSYLIKVSEVDGFVMYIRKFGVDSFAVRIPFLRHERKYNFWIAGEDSSGQLGDKAEYELTVW